MQVQEVIELTTRNHLNTQAIASGDFIATINHDVMCSPKVQEVWATLADGDDRWRAELLCAVSTLWSTIRVHAFADGWTELFETASKKGIRKSLKNKGTEKESK